MRSRISLLAALIAAAALAVAGAGAQTPQPRQTPQTEKTPPVVTPPEGDRTYTEEVTVRVAEVQLLVTDKDGKPVLDLKPDEVEVREEGEKRKIAYLEPFATRDLAVRVLPKAAPLVGGGGDAAEAAAPVGPAFPIPRPVRRIVLLFDPFNSRATDRSKWVAMVRGWVETDMQPEDRVAAAKLDGTRVTILVPFTGDKQPLLQILANDGFMADVPHQDYLADMSSVLDSLKTCAEAYDQTMCGFNAVQAPMYEWAYRATQTIAALRAFNAALAAIPGRKAVMWIGEGFVTDPGELGTAAILSAFGTDNVDRNFLTTRLRRDVYPRYLEMLRVAAASDITYFTFDTRRSSMRDMGIDVDQQYEQHERRFTDPFATTFDQTRAALDVVANHTGGRSHNGPPAVEKLAAAANAFEGLYTVGYYRDAGAGSRPRIKVRLKRKGLEVTFPDRYDPLRNLPVTTPMEVAVVGSRPYQDGVLVPVAIQVPLDTLAFARAEEGGGYVASVSAFAEAVAPDGRRAAELFEIVEVKLTPKDYDERIGKRFGHALGLLLQPGSYRLRARVSDDVFRYGAERAIDVTVRADGKVVPGIQELGQNQSPERP